MNIFRVLLGVIFFFLFFSCNTRKKTVTKESVKTIHDTLIKRDSIIVEREKVILLPSINTDVISSPCDSIGKLKVIERIIKIPYGEVKVNTKGDNLKIQVKTDSISSLYEKVYRERNSSQLTEINELRIENEKLKITPFNWWKWIGWISIGFNFIFIGILIKNRFFLN
ncbi:hypothetical protein ETU09_00090 [Apibacter muscae]|uniref:Lipoprotein n=1 Tax=Apibacter muscae TaxID=2509004 RepID=A0A563DMB4_9FLAO|nr:hypothetical protein [Apibacter muscae]TWP31162.1 hypothetical protein ETU09_00090 [Apibacter muscae]